MPFALLYWLHASYYGHVLTQSGTLLSCLTALEEPECVYAHHLSPLAQCSVVGRSKPPASGKSTFAVVTYAREHLIYVSDRVTDLRTVETITAAPHTDRVQHASPNVQIGPTWNRAGKQGAEQARAYYDARTRARSDRHKQMLGSVLTHFTAH